LKLCLHKILFSYLKMPKNYGRSCGWQGDS
jgi:hypothetical protein